MHNGINKLARLVSLSFVQMALLQLTLASLAHADETAPAVPSSGGAVAAAAAPGRPTTLETLMPFILMFGVMYLLILRPQQKKMKEQQEMLSKLAAGDEVVTTSGILGRVDEVSEKIITLEVAQNVRMKFLRSQVAQKVSSELKS
jgi:preprotein translocase subunit YajC